MHPMMVICIVANRKVVGLLANMKRSTNNNVSVKPLKIKDFSKRVDWDKPLNLEQLLALSKAKAAKRKANSKKAA